MKWIRSRIARHPKRAMVLGKTLLLAGSIPVVGAVFARSGLDVTWPVPQGPVGFSIAAALVLAGLGLTVLAEKAAKR